MLIKAYKHKVVPRILCVVTISAFLVSGVSSAMDASGSPELLSKDDSALAPPLRTASFEYYFNNETKQWDVRTYDDGIRYSDTERYKVEKSEVAILDKIEKDYRITHPDATPEEIYRIRDDAVREKLKGRIPGHAIRNRWAFTDMSLMIGHFLKITKDNNLQRPAEMLIPLMWKHIDARNGRDEVKLEGYDIDGIKEVKEGDAITGFSLPVMRNGEPVYRLVYSLNSGDTAIPMSDGTTVWVTTRLAEEEQNIFAIAEQIRNKNTWHDVVMQTVPLIQGLSYYLEYCPNQNSSFTEVIELMEKLKQLKSQIENAMDANDQIAAEGLIDLFLKSVKEFIALLSPDEMGPLFDEIARVQRDIEHESEKTITEEREFFDRSCRNIRLMFGRLIGAYDEKPKEIDMSQILDAAIQTLPDEMQKKVRKKYPPNLYLIVGYEIKLHELFMNLLTNAREITKGSGVLELELFKQNNELIVRVSDNGPGMPKEKADAFNAGQQVASSKGEAGGRGLNIVRSMVQDHSGTIEVDSLTEEEYRKIQVEKGHFKDKGRTDKIYSKPDLQLEVNYLVEMLSSLFSEFNRQCEEKIKTDLTSADVISLYDIYEELRPSITSTLGKLSSENPIKIVADDFYGNIFFSSVRAANLANRYLGEQEKWATSAVEWFRKDYEDYKKSFALLKCLAEGRRITPGTTFTIRLPVKRNGEQVYRLVYNLKSGDTAIQMSDGVAVWVTMQLEQELIVPQELTTGRKNTLVQLRGIKSHKALTTEQKRLVRLLIKYFGVDELTPYIEMEDLRVPPILSALIPLVERFNQDIYFSPLSAEEDARYREISAALTASNIGHMLRHYGVFSNVFSYKTEKINPSIQRLLTEYDPQRELLIASTNAISSRGLCKDGHRARYIVSLLTEAVGHAASCSAEILKILATDATLYDMLEAQEKGTVDRMMRYSAEATDFHSKLLSWQKNGLDDETRHATLGALMVEIENRVYRLKRDGIKIKLARVGTEKLPLEPQNPIPLTRLDVFHLIDNLLSNALDARNPNEELIVTYSVRLNREDNPSEFVFTFGDNGPGMSKEKVDAFNASLSVQSSKSKDGGRGLSIIREIVKNNNGTISVESELGKGTTFTLRLPVVNEPSSGQAVRLPIGRSPQALRFPVASETSFPRSASLDRARDSLKSWDSANEQSKSVAGQATPYQSPLRGSGTGQVRLPIASQGILSKDTPVARAVQQIVQIPESLSELETMLEVDKIILSLTPEQQNELKAELDSFLKGPDERQRHLAETCLEEIRIVGLLKDVPSFELSAYKHMPLREIPYQWAQHAAPVKYISGTLNYGFFNVISGWKTFWAIGQFPVRTPADLRQNGPRDVTFTYAVPKLLEWLLQQGNIYFLRDGARVAYLPPALRQEIVEEIADEEARGIQLQRRKKLLHAEDTPDKKGNLGHLPSLFIDVDATWLQNQKLLPDDYQKLIAGLKIIRQRQRLLRQYLKKEDLFMSSVELVGSPEQLPADFVANTTTATQVTQLPITESSVGITSHGMIDEKNAPVRLTIEKARQKLLEDMKALHALYTEFHKACAESIQVLEKGGKEEYEKGAHQKLIKSYEALKAKVDTLRGITWLLGFSEPQLKGRLDSFISELAKEFKVDKIVMDFQSGITNKFAYSCGLSAEQLTDIYINWDDILGFLREKHGLPVKGDSSDKAGATFLRSGIASVCCGKPESKLCEDNDDNYINVVIGRTGESVKKYGELTKKDEEALARRLNILIEQGDAPWVSAQKFLRQNGYYDFMNFMAELRHNGGVDTIDLELDGFINRTEKILHTIPPSIKSYISMLRRIAADNADVGRIETFIDMLEKGVNLKPHTVNGYVSERAGRFGDRVRSKGLDFILEVAPDEIIVSKCDLNLLGTIIDSLMDNAIKYTQKGSVKVRLTKRPAKLWGYGGHELECAVLEVEDTGIGIPKKELTDIYYGHYRASNVGEIPGTGIGLDIVYRAVHEMYGNIEVESRLGEGTKFSVFLPMTYKEITGLLPKSEQVHRDRLADTLKFIQAQPQTQPLIVALGTSWIKGYEKGRYLQYDAINPLIGNIRSYCESKGIPFIDDDDSNLLARIKAERAKKGMTDAKVVVLAGEDTVKGNDFAGLRNDDKNAFVVGINSQELTTDSYIRLMEMLTMALKLSAGLEVTQDSTVITIKKDDTYKIYIFIPHAEPMDYERLKHTYEVQKFA